MIAILVVNACRYLSRGSRSTGCAQLGGRRSTKSLLSIANVSPRRFIGEHDHAQISAYWSRNLIESAMSNPCRSTRLRDAPIADLPGIVQVVETVDALQHE
jgi:hypothetical protein